MKVQRKAFRKHRGVIIRGTFSISLSLQIEIKEGEKKSMHKITGSLHCSHFLLFPFDFSVAVLLFSGQVKTSFHLGKGTKVKVISGKPKWYLSGFLPFSARPILAWFYSALCALQL